ncbi:FAD-dependent oxidoreductase [uncultured Algoriphagus sp.]|uniref:FAD-dependent oxidoreductase n=1 Tax=uncultured Algoriphagus sp. TaxID=417365 RepID=UPI0030EEB222
MKKPIIFLLDDDSAVLKSVERDVRAEFRKNYRIIATQSAKEALDALPEFKKKGENVALFLSDQRMPEMLGVAFLEKAKAFYPDAKRILLTAYSDTDAAIKAINEVKLDYYLLKPWDPPEEKLHPILRDQLEAWQCSYIPEASGLRIVGHQWSPKSHQIKDFLSGNLVPYRWMNIETSAQGKELLELNGIEIKDLPAVFFDDGSFLTNPTTSEVGEKSGMSIKAKQAMYDVAVIGAGPAGLAASVYGGSEGLNTLLIEKRAPGGQAGTSSRIENYLGFPNGLSGSDLSRRAITQATRFGIEFLSPQEVVNIEIRDTYKIISLQNGDVVNAKTIIISTGVEYRKHPAKGIDEFTGAGIYYGAATTEAASCENEDIYIVGGGNSAGQAAMYLSKFARKVFIVVRKPDLSSSMSQYLIDQINATPTIEVIGNSEITEVSGEQRLSELVLKNGNTGKEEKRVAAALFIFIGAKPMTDWLHLDIIKDSRGFLETGPALARYNDFRKNWKLKRDPLLLETCIPGVFAAGDVRSGAMNRVASAVGEGSMAIKFVHEYLAEN